MLGLPAGTERLSRRARVPRQSSGAIASGVSRNKVASLSPANAME